MGQLYSIVCCQGTQQDIEKLVTQNNLIDQNDVQQDLNQSAENNNSALIIDQQQSQQPVQKPQEYNQQNPSNIQNQPEIQKQEESKQEIQVKPQQKNPIQSQDTSQVQAKPLKSWELKRQQQKKLNIEDYRFIGQTNQLLIKRPGEINGKQFVIDNCKDCTILIMDSSSTLSIDDCENCRIFIGPSQSSVFVRTTKNSNLIIACGQFRSRDCKDLKILLQCRSQPVIESSSNMQFGCFKFYYKELIEQFKKESLNIWNNNWSDIYDFTKNPNFLNYSYIPTQLDEIEFLKSQSFDIFSVIQKYEQSNLIVPLSLGLVNQQFEYESMFMLQYDEQLDFLVQQFNSLDNFVLKRSYMTTIDQSKLNLLDCGNEVLNQKCLFLYICSNNINITENFENCIVDHFKPMQKNEVIQKYIKKTWTEKSECKNMCDLIYQNWEDERH